jgi:hypothetical protein
MWPPEAKTLSFAFVLTRGKARDAKKARKMAVFRIFRLYNRETRLYHETRKAAFRMFAHASKQAVGRIDFKGALWLAAE